MVDIQDRLSFIKIKSIRYYTFIRVAVFLIATLSVFFLAHTFYVVTINKDRNQLKNEIDIDILEGTNAIVDYTQAPLTKYNFRVEKLKKIITEPNYRKSLDLLLKEGKKPEKRNYDEYEYKEEGWSLFNPQEAESVKIRALKDNLSYATQVSGLIYPDFSNHTRYEDYPFVIYQLKKESEGKWIINKTYPIGIGFNKSSIRHTKEYILPYGTHLIDCYNYCFDRLYNSADSDEYKQCDNKALQIEQLIRYPSIYAAYTKEQYNNFLTLLESKYHKITFRNSSSGNDDALKYLGSVPYGQDRIYFDIQRRHLFLIEKDNNLKSVVYGIAGGVYLLLICFLVFFYIPHLRKRYKYAGVAWMSETDDNAIIFLFPFLRKRRIKWISENDDIEYTYELNAKESKIRLDNGKIFKVTEENDLLVLYNAKEKFKYYNLSQGKQTPLETQNNE